ncbi:hypothetical protein QQP08_011676 [Theobroma cacao]|nr:hypothetical protein QQP08_011676 [Theobroma cacao]
MTRQSSCLFLASNNQLRDEFLEIVVAAAVIVDQEAELPYGFPLLFLKTQQCLVLSFAETSSSVTFEMRVRKFPSSSSSFTAEVKSDNAVFPGSIGIQLLLQKFNLRIQEIPAPFSSQLAAPLALLPVPDAPFQEQQLPDGLKLKLPSLQS